jgi:hypothetical protein
MAIDNKTFPNAREQFWKDYHEKIEGFGRQLSREGAMRSADEGISILATIQPAYSHRDLKKIRKILPREYVYQGEKIRVYIFPSVADLTSRFGV